jgi:Zn-dependent M28 family amino/carboxypeptidase
MTKIFIHIIGFLLVILSCKQTQKMQEPAQNVNIPVFNADSAYRYTENQLAFGPRVLNTSAHEACGNYLAGELRRFGAEVIEQETDLPLADNTLVSIKNIIGSFAPEKKNRILLFAHWDTRPYADHDPDPENWNKPIDGANDGAGACAALLEIARQIAPNLPEIGIDIIFFDAEDWGKPHFPTKNTHHGNWCMGSEYWSKNPHVPNYTARFGILLDMVSAPGAQFFKEYYSMQYASHVIQKVWEAAKATGYDGYFINRNSGGIQDDHVPVIQNRKIPCIDIIQCDPNSDSSFAGYWHTLDDNIKNVSKETLQAVGQTVLYVLYKEN